MTINHNDCSRSQLPVRDTLAVVGGKWKLVILSILMQSKAKRFRDLQRSVGSITAGMLSKELKELELNRLVDRQVIATTPVTVEYSLSEYGKTLQPVLLAMYEWGVRHRQLIMSEDGSVTEAALV